MNWLEFHVYLTAGLLSRLLHSICRRQSCRMFWLLIEIDLIFQKKKKKKEHTNHYRFTGNKNDQETIVSSSVLQNSQIMIVKTMYIFQCKRAENLIVLNNSVVHNIQKSWIFKSIINFFVHVVSRTRDAET